MEEFKHKIEEAVETCYSEISEVCGENLHELGEWVDIIKDISEAEYYEAMKNKIECESMTTTGEEKLNSIVMALEAAVSGKLDDITDEQAKQYKAKLTKLISEI